MLMNLYTVENELRQRQRDIERRLAATPPPDTLPPEGKSVRERVATGLVALAWKVDPSLMNLHAHPHHHARAHHHAHAHHFAT